MPAIPQTPPLGGQAVPGKWHTTVETGLALLTVVVFFFAVLVLWVVTHMNATHLSKLKATIRRQNRELRKFRRKTVEQALLVKNTNGDAIAGDGYGTLDDAKRQKRMAKIRP